MLGRILKKDLKKRKGVNLILFLIYRHCYGVLSQQCQQYPGGNAGSGLLYGLRQRTRCLF